MIRHRRSGVLSSGNEFRGGMNQHLFLVVRPTWPPLYIVSRVMRIASGLLLGVQPIINPNIFLQRCFQFYMQSRFFLRRSCRTSFDFTCRLWNSLTGDCIHVFADNQQAVFTLEFSQDGVFLATGGGDGLFHVYNVNVRNIHVCCARSHYQISL